jgi:hypothetical protein
LGVDAGSHRSKPKLSSMLSAIIILRSSYLWRIAQTFQTVVQPETLSLTWRSVVVFVRA